MHMMSKLFPCHKSEGCCICRVKVSSSRFTSSDKYEHMFYAVFRAEKRSGQICNACVLVVKRYWAKYGRDSHLGPDFLNHKDWRHYVDKHKHGKAKVRKGRVRQDKDVPSTCSSPSHEPSSRPSKKHKYIPGARAASTVASMVAIKKRPTQFYPHHDPYPILTSSARQVEALDHLFPDLDDDMEEEAPVVKPQSPKVVHCRSPSPVYPTPARSPEHPLFSPIKQHSLETSGIQSAITSAMHKLSVTPPDTSVYFTPVASPAGSNVEEDAGEEAPTGKSSTRSHKGRKHSRPLHLKDRPETQLRASEVVDTSSAVWQSTETCCGRGKVYLGNILLSEDDYHPCAQHSRAPSPALPTQVPEEDLSSCSEEINVVDVCSPELLLTKVASAEESAGSSRCQNSLWGAVRDTQIEALDLSTSDSFRR